MMPFLSESSFCLGAVQASFFPPFCAMSFFPFVFSRPGKLSVEKGQRNRETVCSQLFGWARTRFLGVGGLGMREIEIQVSHFSQWGLVFPRRGFQLRGLSDKNAVSPSSSICQWSQRRKNGAHQVSCSFEASVAISGLSFFCGLGNVIFLWAVSFFLLS